MRHPRARRLAVELAVVCAWLLPAMPADAGTAERAEELLLRARKVSVHETFAGIVEVTWKDDTGAVQVQRVIASGVEGAFMIGLGAQRSVGEGGLRYTSGTGDRTSVHGRGPRDAPSPGAAWDLEVVARRQVAGRPAVVVAARDDDGRARAKFAIDRETGQLLRRAVLDRRGHVVRVVEFVAIITGAEQPVSVPAPEVPEGTDVTAPVAIDEVPAGFLSPGEIGGYRLLGRYLQPDGGLQLYFGDGLFTLSVFQSEGRVDWDALPVGSTTGIEELRSRAYGAASGTIVVWGQDGLVLTMVGDGPRDHVMDAVAEVSGRGEGNWFDDAVDFVLGPFGWE